MTGKAGRLYDVVSVGAGRGGSATALRLRQRGVGRVLLAEAGRFDRPRIGESVPPDTGRLLGQLGVLDGFLAQNHERCLGSASSWGDSELGYNDFVTNPYGNGWHLDRIRFDGFLAGCAAECGARLVQGWRFEGLGGHKGRGYKLRFRTDSGGTRRVRAAMVVDATGQAARVSRLLGARRRVSDRLICVGGRLGLADGSGLGKLTMLEAVDYGWWYAARLPDGTALVSVTTDPAICRRRDLRQPQSWLWHLARTHHLGTLLDGSGFDPQALEVYPAVSFRLDPACADGWIAVGDAASAYDPLASQGIHKALASGIDAGDAIAARLLSESADFGDYAARLARQYEEYLGLRSYLYEREGRWPEREFWKVRSSPQRHPRFLVSSCRHSTKVLSIGGCSARSAS